MPGPQPNIHENPDKAPLKAFPTMPGAGLTGARVAPYYGNMRTTIDIDDALMRKIVDRARKSGQSLKTTLNDVVARGLAGEAVEAPIDLPAWDMGRPLHPIDRAWEIAESIELDSVRHEMERGS